MNRAGTVVARVIWRFRYDLLAVLAVAAVMVAAVAKINAAALQAVAGVVPLLGIVVAIFIGFRNRNAYNRWWEARTLWSGVIVNARSLGYALIAYENGTAEMATITGRIRRRESRHAWQLAAELHDAAPPAALADLTGEDPPACTATELLHRQAADIGELSRAGLIDRQARRVLVTINSSQVAAAAGLERIRRQPVPRFYDLFTRGLAWFFAVVVCTRMDTGGHTNAVGIALGIVIMMLVILAERLGHLLEQPMSDDVFGLPLTLFCTELTADLLGPSHSLALAQPAGTVSQVKGR